MLNRRLINTKVAGGGGGCTDIVDNYDPFGDSSGLALYQLNGDATDVSGNYDGTAYNITWGGAGVFGTSAAFNGSSSYIDVPAFNQGTEVSVSFWLNKSSGGEAIQVIADKRTGGWNNFYIYHYLGKTSFQVRSSDAAWVLDVSSTIGVWDFYTMTFGSGTLRIYKNGQFISEDTTAVMTPTNNAMRIGRINDSTVYNLLGSLDQVRIFNTALTPLEVEALYTEELCICDGTVDTLDILGDGSCIATYQLDGNANDLSGNYSGTPTNVSYGVGEFDLAGVFNGSSSFINTNYPWAFTSIYSISFWAKTSTINTRQMMTAVLASSGADASGRFGFGFTSSNTFEFYIANGTSFYTNTSVSSISYQDNQWHNYIVVVNGTSIKLYVDGNTTPIANLTSTVLGTASSDSLFIGKFGAYPGVYFNGSIDQVRIFNKALDQNEVDTLYAETACTYGGRQSEGTQILGDTSCIAYYKLDGTADDETGTYNGTFTTPNYGNGEFLYAGVFNGTSSFIDTNAKIPASLDFSVSFWMKSSDTSSGSHYIFGTKGNYLTNGWFISNDAGYIRYGEGNGVDNATNYFSPSVVADSNWNHIVVTRAAGGTINMYVNDSRVVTDASVGTYFMTSSTWAYDTHIGRYAASSALFYDGEIDQIRIFNKAISPSEVTTLYNEGI